MPNSSLSFPNAIKQRDPELYSEIKEFRARFEEMLLDSLDSVLINPRFRDRGHFLPSEDIRAIAQVLHVLTSESWTEAQLDQFDESWRHALRSDLFAEAFESIRFRIETAVGEARRHPAEERDASGVVQGTLW